MSNVIALQRPLMRPLAAKYGLVSGASGKAKGRMVALLLRQQLMLERAFAPRARRVIAAQGRAAADAFERHGDPQAALAAAVAAVDTTLPQAKRALELMYRTAYAVLGHPMIDAILGKKSRGFEARSEDDQFAVLLQQFIDTYGLDRAAQITNTTKDQLRQIIAAGVAAGDPMGDMAKQIREKVEGLGSLSADLRAAVIARTEIHTASNSALRDSVLSTGLQPNKEWATIMDGREREAHAAANGQVVGFHDPFVVEGEDLSYPGDPRGSADNVINCRCQQLFLAIE